MYQKFPKNVLKVVHCKQKCQYILTVPKCTKVHHCFSSFWILLVQYIVIDHIIWEIAKNFLDNLLQNTENFLWELYEFPQQFPNWEIKITWLGTL